MSFTRADERLTLQGSISAINIVNLGYEHSFTPALSAVAVVSDLFSGQRYRRVIATPLVTQVYERSVQGRITFVGLTYAFGGPGKERQSNFEYDSGS